MLTEKTIRWIREDIAEKTKGYEEKISWLGEKEPKEGLRILSNQGRNFLLILDVILGDIPQSELGDW